MRTTDRIVEKIFPARSAILVRLLFALALGIGARNPAAGAVEQWGVFELALRGSPAGNPYLDTQFSARFTQGEKQVTVPGFHDGEGRFKIRFSPPATGRWRYETASNQRQLNGKTGAFTARPPSRNNHGPVEVFETFYLRYADGTPYHQFGTTVYAWVHQPAALQEQTLKTLAASPFNKLRFCVFPKSFAYNTNEPEVFAFQKKAGGGFDFNAPDPVFWRRFEQRILDLQKLGIEADVILWHPYDRWGFAEMSDAEDDRYLRYCLARLSAYRHVWWSLANEYDFMTERTPPGQRGNKQYEDWDRFFSILEQEDPHQRLRGIHNARRFYDHTKSWVTHASVQSSDLAGGGRFRERYRRPVIYDECKYEGNIRQSWGRLTAREMVRCFWLGTLRGCYVGHGETYQDPDDVLWWAKGGVLRGESPVRIAWLKEIMRQAPAFNELQPAGGDQGRFVLAKPGEFYLVYCTNAAPGSIELGGTHPYQIEILDPWEMTVTPAGLAPPGPFTFEPPKADVAFRFKKTGARNRDQKP